MDRFERKLNVFGVPLYKVKNEQEIIPIVLKCIKDEISTNSVTIKRVAGPEYSADDIESGHCIYIFDAMIGIEESAVLILDGEAIDFMEDSSFSDYFSLLLKREDIVESMELAMLKTSDFSEVKKNGFDLLKPEDIPSGCFVFILDS